MANKPAISFKMDDSNIWALKQALKMFPKETGKWAAKMVNDMAFEYKGQFLGVIGSRYKIRNPGFIGGSVKVEKARPRSRLEDIAAEVGTVSKPRFSGFTEEVGGQDAQRTRAFTLAGRGGRWENVSRGWARMHPSNDPTQDQKIPSINDVQGLPENQRFMALMNMIASKKIPIAPKANTFILKGGKYNKGLYRFDGKKFPTIQKTGTKGKKLKPRFDPDAKLNMVQIFKPIKKQKEWDWPEDVMKKVQQKFTPRFLFNNYIAPAINGIMPEKKPWPKK
jgi:hypothetical protein